MTDDDLADLAYKCPECGGIQFILRGRDTLQCAHDDCGEFVTIAQIGAAFAEMEREHAH